MALGLVGAGLAPRFGFFGLLSTVVRGGIVFLLSLDEIINLGFGLFLVFGFCVGGF